MQVRENFADTAFWRGDISTDAQGNATVSLKLPDNLTTWVMRAVGVDAQTRVVMQEELVRLARQHPRTVLFITHAVEEAVYLADRVVVMSRRPGTIREVIDVRSVRERERWDDVARIEDVMDQATFVHFRTHIWKLLREQQEQDKH